MTDLHPLFAFGEFVRFGERCRVEVRLKDFVGTPTEVEAFPPDGGVVTIHDARHPLADYAPAEMRLRWKDRGALALASTRPASHVQGLLRTDLDGDGAHETLEFGGYMVPGTYTEIPANDLADTELGFMDGLGTQNRTPAADPSLPGYDPDQAETLHGRLVAWLGALSGTSGLHAEGVVGATDIRPTGATGEPLEAVSCRDAAFVDADGNTVRSVSEAARHLAGRLGGRLFLDTAPAQGGEPTWRVVSRGHLASGAVPAWDALSLGIAAGALDSAASSREAQRISQAAPVAVEVERSFQVPLSTVIVNDSFEEGTGTGPGSTIDGWTLVGGAYRYDLEDYDPDAANRFALDLRTAEGDSPGYATQSSAVFAVGGPDSSYDLEVVNNAVLSGGVTPTFSLEVSIGSHGFREGKAKIKGTLKGDGVSVECAALLVNANADSDAVPGVVVALAGTVMGTPNGGSLTLTEDAHVGDTVLIGNLSETFSGSTTVGFGYFGPSGSSPNTLAIPKSNRDTFSRWFRRAPATDCTGAVVSGSVYFAVYGPPAPVGLEGSFFSHLYQRARIGLLGENGRPPNGSTTRAGISGAEGEGVLSIPLGGGEAFTIGDGPLPNSAGALLVGGTPTGPLSGGTWTVDHLAGTFQSIDAALAVSGLAQLGVDSGSSPVPLVWDGRMLLRNGVRIPRDRPLTLYHPDRNGGWDDRPHWWDRTAHDWTGGFADVRATELRLADVSSALITYALDS